MYTIGVPGKPENYGMTSFSLLSGKIGYLLLGLGNDEGRV